MASDLSVQLGIPLAGWGIIHFVVVGAMLLLLIVLGDGFQIEGTLAALVLCTIATVLGVVLTGTMFTSASAFCPLCVVIHVINLLLIPSIKAASNRTWAELFRLLGSGVRYVFGAQVDDPALARWKVTGLVTAALAGIVAYQWVLIQSDRQAAAPSQPRTFQDVLADYEAGQDYEIPLGDDDPWLGDQHAPVHVVVFSDFQCPACQGFSHALAHLKDEHPEVAMIFKHYPLSTQCNAEVGFDLHPLSCDAAYAAEAARRQGKFWEYHDALFAASEPLEASTLRKLATEVGLEMDQFEVDLIADSTKAKIDADVALGNQVKVDGTPTVYLNNKMVFSEGMAYLEQLLQHLAPSKGENEPSLR